jgi:hypothetical protein
MSFGINEVQVENAILKIVYKIRWAVPGHKKADQNAERSFKIRWMKVALGLNIPLQNA